jgi:hypothetical protein
MKEKGKFYETANGTHGSPYPCNAHSYGLWGSPEQNARVVRTILESELSNENLKF